MANQELAVDTLKALRYGQAEAELSEAISEAVQAARDTGKQSVITMKITIKPQGNSGQYFITDEISTKLPKLPKEQTIMFGTPEGNLLRDDPRQQKLPLRDLPQEPMALKVKNVHDLPAIVKNAAG
jgi:hypothetical protein